MKPKVYLAGQWNEHENDWKDKVKQTKGFSYYDPEYDSDQSSPNTYYPEDLTAIRRADILIANPGIAPSEGTWIEIGYFLALNTKKPEKKCVNLIIIWKKDRSPKWSIEFVKKAGALVSTTEQAIDKLKGLKNFPDRSS